MSAGVESVTKRLLMKVISGASPDVVVESILQDFHVIPRRQERREVEGLVHVRSLGVERKNKVTWMIWVVFQNQRYERYYHCKRDAEEYASRLGVMNDGWLQTHLKHFTKVGGVDILGTPGADKVEKFRGSVKEGVGVQKDS